MHNGHHNNRWKGFMIGMAGSLAGLLAMRAYWQKAAPMLRENVDLGGQEAYPEDVDLDDISLAGQQYREDESATDALGRKLYQSMTGKEPESEETKELLSYLIHWGYGLLQGGLYGAMRGGNGRALDLPGGALFGAGLWLLGDETAVPLAGLQSGPTGVPPAGHLNRLGAHLAYGVATAATTQLLHKLL